MSNIEEFIQEKRQGRAYRELPSSAKAGTSVQVEVDSYGSFLLERLAQQFSMSADGLATELLSAALIDAWTAAGNPMPADDEIFEHYGEEAREQFDEMG